MRIYLLLAMAAGASFIGSNCGGQGVGDPCVPEDEYLTGFSGFSQSEVNVESRSFQCLTRVCLVNHFQGRVSCPYGQVEDPDAENSGLSTCMGTEEHRASADCLPGGNLHMQSCQVPDRDGARWEDRIIPPVQPQLTERQADDTVYCSCRCDGEDSGADYCTCPSGFECRELVEDLGIGREQLAGSYCIRNGTLYDPGIPATEPCDPDTPAERCDSKYTITVDGVDKGTNQRVGACLPPGAACDKGDTCCKNRRVACNDTAGSEERNCFGTCQGCDGGDCCVYESGAAEPIYEVERVSCDGSCSESNLL